MTRVQIVVASRHGGTLGIAERIAEVLRAEGIATTLARAEDRPEVAGFDAHIVGSGVYMGSWLKEATTFLEDNEMILATRPVWLFSSGPVLAPDAKKTELEPIDQALGPTSGPGSGGHRRIVVSPLRDSRLVIGLINELSDVIRPRGHVVFGGRYDPSDPPTNLAERVVRLMPAVQKVLPTADERPWGEIEAWAHELASELETVPVA